MPSSIYTCAPSCGCGDVAPDVTEYLEMLTYGSFLGAPKAPAESAVPVPVTTATAVAQTAGKGIAKPSSDAAELMPRHSQGTPMCVCQSGQVVGLIRTHGHPLGTGGRRAVPPKII